MWEHREVTYRPISTPAACWMAVSMLLSACVAASPDDTVQLVTTPALVQDGPDSAEPVAGSIMTTGTTAAQPPDENFSLTFTAQIDNVFPHDREAFTQGLALQDGLFYESTGIRGASTVRIVDPASGEVLASVDLPDEYFGEGLEVLGDRIVQLTWQSETAFIWDVHTLELLGTYSYEGEGWGLCVRDNQFYMSNGSSQLTVRDIETFEPVETINVRFRGEPVENLNELECTASEVYANVWKSDVIVVVDPGTGFVIGRVATDMLTAEVGEEDGIDVLNGIAYDPATDSFFLTGKYWPKVFQVHLELSG